MNVPAVGLYAVLGAVALFALYAVWVIIPREFRAMYRLELWALRDDLVADITQGRIRKSAPAVAMLNLMEHAIIRSDEFTAGRVFLLFFENRDAHQEEFLHNGVPDVDALRVYRARLTEVRAKWFLRTSISGWLAIVWIPAVWVGYRIIARRPLFAHVPDRIEVVSKRIDSTGKQAMRLDRPDPMQLAHCVG